MVILENEVFKCSDELIVMTDDGSYGKKGFVTDGVEAVLLREKVDEVVAIGAGYNDEICVGTHATLFCSNHLFAEHHNGRRHGDVRRM